MSSVIFMCIIVSIQLISCQCRTFQPGSHNGYGNMAYSTANNLAYYMPSVAYGSYMPFSTNGIEYGSRPSANGLANNGLIVTSSSSIVPNGVSFFSDSLVIDGTLAVFGQLPVLATVALDGNIYGSGQSSVSYGCGNIKNLAGINYLSGYNTGFSNPIGYNLVKGYRY